MATRKAKRTTRRAPAAKTRARKKAPRKIARKKAAPKKAAATARPKTPTAEAIARKIVRAAKEPGRVPVEELYAEDCVSWEPGMTQPMLGIEGRRAKDEQWEDTQDSSKAVWNAQNIFVKKNTVCIEWQADLVMRDGRSVKMQEVAIHQVKGGKIVEERFFYDRAALAPPAEPPAPRAPAPPAPAPSAPRPSVSAPNPAPISSPAESYLGEGEGEGDAEDDPTLPKVDPMDL